ncbi:MAG: hypothetical protein R3F13_10865 [Prosthecobacter sp.]
MENSETKPLIAAQPAPSSSSAESGNPFSDDVCTGPFAVEEQRTVAGLNADILEQLITNIDEGGSAASGQPLLLLTAPRAGYGKTHLLGRLAAAADGQVVLMPLAFRLEDEIGISSVAVRGLESMARSNLHAAGWTKFRQACAGVCAALLRNLVGAGVLPCANAEQAMRVLNGDPSSVFDLHGEARLIGEWVRRHEAQLRKPLAEAAMKRVPAIPAVLEAWVDALLNHALDGGMSKMAALRVLAADSVNEGPATFLRLLGLWRPVVLLVDHLDAYYRKPEIGLRIATLLLDMAEMDGVNVVLSLNQDVWQATFGHHLPSGMEDRLTSSQMLLRGIGAEDAAKLLELRLRDAKVSEEESREFTQFVDVKRYFLGRPLGSVSARAFLRHAAQQWEFFQHTQASPVEVTPSTPLVESEDSESGGIVPLMTDTLPDEESPEEATKIFDAGTTEQMKVMAEGLAEPTPALPQENEAPLNGLQQTGSPVEAVAPTTSGVPTPQFSPDSKTAFESLREMLGKLRQPGTAPAALGLAAATAAASAAEEDVATRLASVMNHPQAPVATEPVAKAPPVAAPVALPPPTAVADGDQDVLRGRFEALRMQMAAEAVTLPLDYTKLSDLIRLAGRRFPLVRLTENELPGMTGRYVMTWAVQGIEVIFGLANFADESYWRTLSGFAAGKLAEASLRSGGNEEVAPKIKVVTFKTDREQAHWQALQGGSVLPEVLRPVIEAIHLDSATVASLYAMQRIIKESETGVLEVPPAQVMSVLARELDFFWKRVTRAG